MTRIRRLHEEQTLIREELCWRDGISHKSAALNRHVLMNTAHRQLAGHVERPAAAIEVALHAHLAAIKLVPGSEGFQRIKRMCHRAGRGQKFRAAIDGQRFAQIEVAEAAQVFGAIGEDRAAVIADVEFAAVGFRWRRNADESLLRAVRIRVMQKGGLLRGDVDEVSADDRNAGADDSELVGLAEDFRVDDFRAPVRALVEPDAERAASAGERARVRPAVAKDIGGRIRRQLARS